MSIVAITIEYLKEALGTDEVYSEVPENPAEEFFVVDKTGGGETNLIKSAMLAIQSYAGSKARAEELNEELKDAMRLFPSREEIGGCHLNSDYDFTNVAKKQYRYQAVYDITHY